MYNLLCVAVLLTTSFMAFAQDNTLAGATVAYPVVVARKKLLNQTAAIPTTTIFTPTQTGLYRLSVYATTVAVNTQCGGLVAFNLGWTDDSGPQSENSLLVEPQITLGQFFQQFGGYVTYPGYPMGGPVLTFEAIAGQPITYSVTDDIGCGSVTYSLYYTLERLE